MTDLGRPRIDCDAHVEADTAIGDGTTVWGQAQVRAGASVGRQCVIGRGAFVDAGVTVGDRCKIQNDALLYSPARLGDGVFVGPAVVLTNDLHPRAVNPDGSPKSGHDWESVGVVIGDGASVGARVVCVAPVRVGEWAMVAAGAVVTRDVAPYALVVGVPARQVAWVGRAGEPLVPGPDDELHCPRTGEIYRLRHGALVRDS